MRGLTGAGRRLVNDDLIPEWGENMPDAAPPKLPPLLKPRPKLPPLPKPRPKPPPLRRLKPPPKLWKGSKNLLWLQKST